MPTQEERLTTLEKTVALLQKSSSTGIQELNRNVTMLLGIVSSQQLDIKEIKISQITVEDRLDTMDRRMESGFETLEKRLGGLESGFETLEQRLGGLESGFETLENRLGGLESRFETLEKKADQMLSLLTTLTTRPEQNIQ